jgi:hypothetical protein
VLSLPLPPAHTHTRIHKPVLGSLCSSLTHSTHIP